MHQKLKKKIISSESSSQASLELTTELIMVRALERGLSLRDFEILTVGMLLDYIVEYDNLNLSDEQMKSAVIEAQQSHFDAF